MTWLKCRGWALVLLLVACRPDETSFYKQTFSCNTSDSSAQCGKTKEGAPMMCFASRQLGAPRDFCVQQCQADRDFTEGAASVCTSSKGELQTCRPSQSTPDDPDGCGPELACFRTNLLRDEGVCLAIRVCRADADCPDPALSTCAGTVIKQLYPEAPFQTTNLQCVVGGCRAKQTACPLGDACLPLLVPAGTRVPDICVPSCDSNLNCPPNYTCWRRVSGAASPAVCLPGFQGTRCSNSLDCLVGDCVDTREGFRLCSVPCEKQEDCLTYSNTSERLYCVSEDGSEQRHCVATAPFSGTLCLTDAHCPAPMKCSFASPFHPVPQTIGECRFPCGPDAACPVRAGIPHACFTLGAETSCYPGRLGLPCRSSAQCVPGLTCQGLPPEERLRPGGAGPGERQLCTLACATDADCGAFLGPSDEGYCQAGWCRLGGGPGDPCQRDAQCRGAGRCASADGGAGGSCLYDSP